MLAYINRFSVTFFLALAQEDDIRCLDSAYKALIGSLLPSVIKHLAYLIHWIHWLFGHSFLRFVSRLMIKYKCCTQHSFNVMLQRTYMLWMAVVNCLFLICNVTTENVAPDKLCPALSWHTVFVYELPVWVVAPSYEINGLLLTCWLWSLKCLCWAVIRYTFLKSQLFF